MPLTKNNTTTKDKIFVAFFQVVAQFLVTKRERELDCYYQKVNSRTALRIAERPNTRNLDKKIVFKKTSEILAFDREQPMSHHKGKF